MFASLFVVPCFVIRIAEAAELVTGKGVFGAERGQFSAGNGSFGGEGKCEEKALEDADGILILIEGLGDQAGGKLIASATGSGIAGGGVKDALRTGGIVQIEKNVGFEFGRFVDEDAVRILCFEALQQDLGLGFLVGFVIGPSGQKVGVVGKRFPCFACLVKIGNGVGVTFIEQVRMAQSKVSGSSSFAGMGAGVRIDAGICGRRAQVCQLLGHRPQFRGGDEGKLDFVGTRQAPTALGRANVFLSAAWSGGRSASCG